MKQLFWMGDDVPHGMPQRLAYVWAVNEAEAIEEAHRLGINPGVGDEAKCVDVSHPERIPETFIGRLLSTADLDEIDRLRDTIAGGETASGLLERLVLEIAEIRDALDDVVVRLTRRQHAIAGGAPPAPRLP